MTTQTDKDIRRLLARHARRILRSAIAKPVARARGYRSITTKAELKRLGFSETQCRVPALLLPIWGVNGEIAGYMIRPEDPRIGKNGKLLKYEFVAGSQMALDAHPSIRAQLGDPSIPLWVTEGIFKADAAISQGLCCIAVLGVWNWRGGNEHGGRTALADWESIALNGRETFIVYDSDVMLKLVVHAALVRLGAFLESRGAHVHYVYLPPGAGGTKVGLDDFLAAGNSVTDLLALASSELRHPPDDGADDHAPYAVTPAGMVYRKPTQNGSVDVLLANFSAQITEEVIADDGMRERGDLVIAGTLAGGVALPTITVPTNRFATLDWAVAHWGTRAIVAAGIGTKDRLREAIQRLSPEVNRRRIYEHPGWRNVPEHDWCFLHAGGAIGPNGPASDIAVELRGAAARIVLPDPPTGDELRAAVRTLLDLLDLAPDRITAPLLGAVYRSVLSEVVPADLSLFLVGPTRVFKSELAALAMQHFGVDFDRLHLPANWSATANFLERIGFDFKDLPIVIDDFAPTGSQTDISRLHATADRVLRGIGNRGGRGRMNADGTLRPDYPPRGLVIGTGEDAPRGQSLRARIVITEIGPGDVDRERLTQAQAAGRTGVLVAGMAGYVQYLANQMDDVRADIPTRLDELQAQARQTGTHARTPTALAHLALGWDMFLRFAVAVGAITKRQAKAILVRVWTALGETAQGQARHQLSEEPARRFLELLGSALAGGFAHVAAPTGEAPVQARAWGWREAVMGSGAYERRDWRPEGVRIGWVHADDLYLDLEAALAAVKRLDQGPIGVTPMTLAKRLHEGGYLASTGRENGELRVRRSLQGQRRRVLHLATSAITQKKSGQSVQSSLQEGDDEEDDDNSSDLEQLTWIDPEQMPLFESD